MKKLALIGVNSIGKTTLNNSIKNKFQSPKCNCEIKRSTFQLDNGTIVCCKCELEL